MDWNLAEAVAYYRQQGAPTDQNALIGLMREVQQEHGGAIPKHLPGQIAEALGTKESFLLAVIRRIPSLRLEDTHVLELCGGPNCSKRAALAAFVEKTYGREPKSFRLRYTGCMRMCAKGPNIRWDGTVYHQADAAMIRRLVEGK